MKRKLIALLILPLLALALVAFNPSRTLLVSIRPPLIRSRILPVSIIGPLTLNRIRLD